MQILQRIYPGGIDIDELMQVKNQNPWAGTLRIKKGLYTIDGAKKQRSK